MTFTSFRITLAVIGLSFATYIFVFHYVMLSIHVKNKIRKTNHKFRERGLSAYSRQGNARIGESSSRSPLEIPLIVW
jgi:hypothetical protein